VNKHDLIAANIVAGALESQKLPPAARRAVGRALGLVQAKPPSPTPEALVGPGMNPKETAAISPSDELAQEAQRRIASQYDAIITNLLKERMEAGEIDTSDPRALDAAGHLKQFGYPDGRTEYDLNGKTLVSFWPPEVAFEEEGERSFMLVNQRYRIAV
jgi:hypothetical protein